MAEGSPDSVNLHPPSKLPSREDIDLEDQESSPVAEPSEEMLPLDSTQSEGSFGHLVVSFMLCKKGALILKLKYF